VTRAGRCIPWWAVVLGALSAGAVLAGLVAPAAGARTGAPAGVVHIATGGDARSVTFVGDSWTKGAGATERRGYAVLTGERLGGSYSVLGVGGSGYTRRGPGESGSTFGERIDAAVATGADVIVVQGSLNERRGTLTDLEPAAVETLTRLRAEAAPDTGVLVIGASYNPGTPDATIDRINRAIEAAADQAGIPFVDPAAERWIDPVDPGLWADPIHPNDAGHLLVAEHVARLLLATAGH
jgi:lysophospholipase L1-like esterase